MKVLIGIITSDRKDYCLDMFTQTIMNLNTIGLETDIVLIDNSEDPLYKNKLEDKGFYVIHNPWQRYVRDRITSSRNLLREITLKGNYDYLFSVDSDIFLRKEELQRLISYDKKFVFGPYPIKLDKIGVKLAVQRSPKIFYNLNMIGLGLIKTGAVGMGCTLIHREILEKVKFRNDPKTLTTKEDILFCDDALKLDYSIWTDFSKLISHMNTGWADIILNES